MKKLLIGLTILILAKCLIADPIPIPHPFGSDTQVQYNNGGVFGGSHFYFDDTNDRGYFQPSIDSTTAFQILDADGGTPIFNIDSTNERVGIGNASPYVNLEVGAFGATPAMGTTPEFQMTVGANHAGTAGILFKNTDSGVASDARMAAVDNNGEAYIGFVTPSTGMVASLLGVQGNQATYLWSDDTTGGTTCRHLVMGTYYPKNIVLSTNNIERMRILSTGEIGIGKTPAVGTRLDVIGYGSFCISCSKD